MVKQNNLSKRMQEMRAAEPIMPLEIWKDPLIVVSNLATLTTGVVLIGVSSFLPTYMQGVMECSPLIAGFTLAFMSMGWVASATITGKSCLNTGLSLLLSSGGFGFL